MIEFSFISMPDSDLEIRAGGGRSSRAFRSLAWFRRTRKRLCVNQVRSWLSMCCMLLGYSFEPRPNSRALGTAGSVMLRDLSIKGCSHWKKKSSTKKKQTRLTSPEVRAAVTSKVWGDSGSTSFSPPHSRRQKEALFAGYIWHKAVVLCRTRKLLSTSATPFSICIILHIILSLIQ